MKSAAGLLLALALYSAPTFAQPLGDPTPLAFRDHTEEARFHALAAELRCVQCQNQSLADSDAQIAHDLRREVLSLMQQGQSDTQIKAFLVQRYGQFVLYKPALGADTALLWFGPGLLLAGAAIGLGLYTRRRARTLPSGTGTADQQEREW